MRNSHLFQHAPGITLFAPFCKQSRCETRILETVVSLWISVVTYSQSFKSTAADWLESVLFRDEPWRMRARLLLNPVPWQGARVFFFSNTVDHFRKSVSVDLHGRSSCMQDVAALIINNNNKKKKKLSIFFFLKKKKWLSDLQLELRDYHHSVSWLPLTPLCLYSKNVIQFDSWFHLCYSQWLIFSNLSALSSPPTAVWAWCGYLTQQGFGTQHGRCSIRTNDLQTKNETESMQPWLSVATETREYFH